VSLEEERVPGPAGDSPRADPEELAKILGDFPSFCALLQISPQGGGERIALRLSPIQRARNATRTSRDIVLKSRKVYMTTLEMARDLWWFLTVKGARVVIVCQTEDDHSVRDTLADMLRTMLVSLREWIDIRLDVENQLLLKCYATDASLRIIEAGASRATAMKRARGTAINRLHVTELSVWGPFAIETLTVLLNAMPQDGSGETVLESTPNGAAGYFYDTWQAAVAGNSHFRAQFYPWYHHPSYWAGTVLEVGEVIVPRDDEERRLESEGVPAEAIKWRRLMIGTQGADKIAQEYPGDPHSCFLLSGREFFDSPTTLALLKNASAPLRVIPIRGSGALAELRIWGLPVNGQDYCISADTSEGTGGDESAVIVREVGTNVHMATLSGQVKPGELALHLVRLALTYRRDKQTGALIVVERNGPGLTTLDRLVNVLGYRRVFHDRDQKPGWHTNVASRPAALAGLEQGQRDGTWRTLDTKTLEQMKLFVWREKGSGTFKAEADVGAKDDLIMAEAIGWDVLRRPILSVTRDLEFLESA
jgi:hypothetical protein